MENIKHLIHKIFLLIIIFSLAKCSRDDNGFLLKNIDSETILETQESLYSCCYSKQRDKLPLPLYGCEPNVDSTKYDKIMYLGFFEPLESSIKRLPSMAEGRNFIFTNQIGKQLTLIYRHSNLRIRSSHSELHESDTITLLCEEVLDYDITASSEDLNYEMSISISSKVSYWNDTIYLNDYLVLRRSDSLGVYRTWPGYFNLTINKRNSNENYLYSSNNVHFDEKVLNNILFRNIYTDSVTNYTGLEPLNTYYFSYDYGLVGIEDEFDNLWVLTKIE